MKSDPKRIVCNQKQKYLSLKSSSETRAESNRKDVITSLFPMKMSIDTNLLHSILFRTDSKQYDVSVEVFKTSKISKAFLFCLVIFLPSFFSEFLYHRKTCKVLCFALRLINLKNLRIVMLKHLPAITYSR